MGRISFLSDEFFGESALSEKYKCSNINKYRIICKYCPYILMCLFLGVSFFNFEASSYLFCSSVFLRCVFFLQVAEETLKSPFCLVSYDSSLLQICIREMQSEIMDLVIAQQECYTFKM